MSTDLRNLSGDLPAPSQSAVRALHERVRVLEAELSRARNVEAQARALSESERRFRRIVECTTEGVWTLDADNVTTFVNAAMAHMLGYTPEQMLGRHLFEFVSQEAMSTARANLERRRQGKSEVHEFPLRHAAGHDVWGLVTTCPIEDEQGRYQGALAMILDATERRRMEREQAELAERMVENQKVESLGVLAGGIAHDFNNLLAAIMGHVEIATLDANLPPSVRTALENALAATQRAAGLTRQLLDFSGRGDVELRPMRLPAHTAELVELLRASIPKRVAIELLTPNPSLSVQADPDRLQQATMNLIINAAEAYGGEAGTVSVRVAEEHVASEALLGQRALGQVEPGDYVYLEVRDEGDGMDDATLKRVFEPFFTTKKHGRGLGLAATLGIVRSHGGFLSVRSTPGQGTTFRAYFPQATGSESAEARDAEPRSSAIAHARTLLVIDDEPMVREFAQRLLEAEGYCVLEASTGQAALSLLRTRLGEIDAVLLDLSMPGMDGDTLLAELRAFAPTLPVIVHSGHSAEATSQRLTRWNIAGVLQKPYRAARLSQMVRGLFEAPKKQHHLEPDPRRYPPPLTAVRAHLPK